MKSFYRALFGLLAIHFASASDAITLEKLLQRTLENNPEIQKAKCDLEGAGGRRLVFRAVALPDVKIGVLGGVEGGQRAGQKPVQVFGFGYGGFTQPFFNMGGPASWGRGDTEGVIAPQQIHVGVGGQIYQGRGGGFTPPFKIEWSRAWTPPNTRRGGKNGR